MKITWNVGFAAALMVAAVCYFIYSWVSGIQALLSGATGLAVHKLLTGPLAFIAAMWVFGPECMENRDSAKAVAGTLQVTVLWWAVPLLLARLIDPVWWRTLVLVAVASGIVVSGIYTIYAARKSYLAGSGRDGRP